MKPKHQRLVLGLAALAMVGLAATVIIRNLGSYTVYFYSPSDIVTRPPAENQHIRVGGLVKQGSVTHPDPATIRFTVTDYAHDLTISYTGILPGLFREGQGVIAEGTMTGDVLRADTILAKHDEYYMPPEITKSLKASGHWKDKDGYGKQATP
jgi:cytochrome c-type biogenesis protein CcmE